MKSTVLVSKSAEDTELFAADLARTLSAPRVIALSGDLGAGKTTFVRAFVRALQNGDAIRVKSPSYALHYSYATTPETHHMDLYRLTDGRQLHDLGLIDVIESQEGFVLIEWPELITEQLPRNTIRILFEESQDGARKVTTTTI